MRKAFTWNEIEMWTGSDLIETVQLLDESDAESFMEAYAAVCDDESHAESNIRYIMTLIGRDAANELSELFMIDVPEADEVVSPRQWFANSSLGLKEAA